MAWNDVLPPRGSVATDYPNIRRAIHPTDEDMLWADVVVLVDPEATRRAGVPPMPPLPDPDTDKRLRASAKKAGVNRTAALFTVLAVVGSHNAALALNVLLVGPADLSAKALLIASEETKHVVDRWAGGAQ